MRRYCPSSSSVNVSLNSKGLPPNSLRSSPTPYINLSLPSSFVYTSISFIYRSVRRLKVNFTGNLKFELALSAAVKKHIKTSLNGTRCAFAAATSSTIIISSSEIKFVRPSMLAETVETFSLSCDVEGCRGS